MKNNYFFKMLAIIILLGISFVSNSQGIATFDNLTLNSNSVWYGNDNSGGFSDSGFFFPNSYTYFGDGAYSWNGFAYSNMTDTLAVGYLNQFSAITGKGALNSANYAVSYVYYDWLDNYKMKPNVLSFSTPQTISGFYVTNSSYAYYSMLNGSGSLSKKFGGVTGNDPDWFKLQIKGYRNGQMTDTVDFYLADFRFANNTQDYILKTWQWVDLSALGNIDSLSFGLTSSDMGSYGINTPSYFCMDNFNGLNPNVKINEFANLNIGLNIYPNPFVETLEIVSNQANAKLNVSIYDVNGKEIKKYYFVNQFFVANLTDLTSGIYFVKVFGENFNYYQKVIKK